MDVKQEMIGITESQLSISIPKLFRFIMVAFFI